MNCTACAAELGEFCQVVTFIRWLSGVPEIEIRIERTMNLIAGENKFVFCFPVKDPQGFCHKERMRIIEAVKEGDT